MKCLALLLVAACTIESPELEVVEQGGVNMQGVNMQGVNMQGVNMQGVDLQGFGFDGIWLDGPLTHARIERGELVAERGAVTLRGAALAGARLTGVAVDLAGATTQLAFRIAAVVPEASAYDPTRTGGTFLYTLEQEVAGAWQPACSPDADGRRVAIPVAATFDARGTRVETPGMFTFACTTGVIAKCYRWGYKPWLGASGGELGDLASRVDFDDLHWACTRMARADYCGDGTPHTRPGTAINSWDRVPSPGPIQKHGLVAPVGMVFEAGWSTRGAVCVSRARWLLDDGLANLCPDRLVPPGLLGATVCDTAAEVLLQEPDALMFDEAYLNLGLLGP